MDPICHHLLHIAHQVLIQPPVVTCLDHFFQFLEEICEAMFVCSKRIYYQVTVTWIIVTQPFILHSHKKTILVVKIIVIFQNSAHYHLQTTLKIPNLSCLVISFLLQVISLLYLLQYSIQRYFLFSLLTFHLGVTFQRGHNHTFLSKSFSHQEQAFMALWGNIF